MKSIWYLKFELHRKFTFHVSSCLLFHYGSISSACNQGMPFGSVQPLSIRGWESHLSATGARLCVCVFRQFTYSNKKCRILQLTANQNPKCRKKLWNCIHHFSFFNIDKTFGLHLLHKLTSLSSGCTVITR